MFGNLHNTVRIEIETYHSIVRLRMFGFLLDAQTVPVLVELSYTVAFWVVHIVTKHGGMPFLLSIYNSLLQHPCETTLGRTKCMATTQNISTMLSTRPYSYRCCPSIALRGTNGYKHSAA